MLNVYLNFLLMSKIQLCNANDRVEEQLVRFSFFHSSPLPFFAIPLYLSYFLSKYLRFKVPTPRRSSYVLLIVR